MECVVAGWVPSSDAAEKEDGLRLCTVLLDIKSGVMLRVSFSYSRRRSHMIHSVAGSRYANHCDCRAGHHDSIALQ